MSSIPEKGRSPAVGNVNTLQNSWLKNFMDRGDWWARVYGVKELDTTEATWKACTNHIFTTRRCLVIEWPDSNWTVIPPLNNLKLRFVNANLFLLVTWTQHKQLKRLVYGFVYLATHVEEQRSVSTKRKEWSTSIEPGTEPGNHVSPAGSDDVSGPNPDFGLHLTPLFPFNNSLFSNLVWSYSYLQPKLDCLFKTKELFLRKLAISSQWDIWAFVTVNR